MQLIRLLRELDILAPNRLVALAIVEITPASNIPIVNPLCRRSPDSMASRSRAISFRRPLACALRRLGLAFRFGGRGFDAAGYADDIFQDISFEACGDGDADFVAGGDARVDAGFAFRGRGAVDGADALVVDESGRVPDKEEIRPAFVPAGVAVHIFGADVFAAAIGVGRFLTREVAEDVGRAALSDGGGGRFVDDGDHVAGGSYAICRGVLRWKGEGRGEKGCDGCDSDGGEIHF